MSLNFLNYVDLEFDAFTMLNQLDAKLWPHYELDDSTKTFPFPYTVELYAEFLKAYAVEINNLNFKSLKKLSNFLKTQNITLRSCKIESRSFGYITYTYLETFDLNFFNFKNNCFYFIFF